MTKEEAIRIIIGITKTIEFSRLNCVPVSEAIKLAIKALENTGCGCGLCLAHSGGVCPKLGEQH